MQDTPKQVSSLFLFSLQRFAFICIAFAIAVYEFKIQTESLSKICCTTCHTLYPTRLLHTVIALAGTLFVPPLWLLVFAKLALYPLLLWGFNSGGDVGPLALGVGGGNLPPHLYK